MFIFGDLAAEVWCFASPLRVRSEPREERFLDLLARRGDAKAGRDVPGLPGAASSASSGSSKATSAAAELYSKNSTASIITSGRI